MKRVLFRNAKCIDGTGSPAFNGDVLVENEKILTVSSSQLSGVEAEEIDCTGFAIAPGFIDAHSHNDQIVYLKNEIKYTEPFIRQGITTYVAGNCGFSAAGMVPGTKPNLLLPNDEGIDGFPTYAAYFEYLRSLGLRQNFAMLAGHNTALASVVGLTPDKDTSDSDMRRVEAILNEGMDAGCKGISVGLGYRPGQFVSDDEIRKISNTAIRRNAVISVHSRVLNVHMPSVYGENESEPHNLRWHRSFLELYRNSDAKLQISHLVFCGEKAWSTYYPIMEIFNSYMEHGGMDLWFDMYAYRQGATSVGIMLSHAPYFYENINDIYDRPDKIKVLEQELLSRWDKRGFSVARMMLCGAACQKYRRYQGRFLPDILSETDMSIAEFCMDLYRESHGYATVYFLFEQEEENIPNEMAHPHALYMTDAWYEPDSHQNACAYGSMPKFLRLARESGKMTLEEAVSHMTGLTADRFSLNGRGYLRNGYYADLVVFDPDNIREQATEEKPDQYPTGIRLVYVNGEKLLDGDTLVKTARFGRVL